MNGTIPRTMLVFAGGGIGAVARYLLAGAVQRVAGVDFPFGTLAVNVIGSLCIGLVMSLSERYLAITTQVRLFLAVGALGGFTTYSTFSYETIRLMEQSGLSVAFINVVGTVAGCLLGAWIGLQLGKIL